MNWDNELTFGSLFSGTGNVDRGLERAGWRCQWQIESDYWCRQELQNRWPHVEKYVDIAEVGFNALPPVKLLVGQFSSNYVLDSPLWPEYLRAVRECRPTLVLGTGTFELNDTVLAWIVRGLETLDCVTERVRISSSSLDIRQDRIWVVGWANNPRCANDCPPDPTRWEKWATNMEAIQANKCGNTANPQIAKCIGFALRQLVEPTKETQP